MAWCEKPVLRSRPDDEIVFTIGDVVQVAMLVLDQGADGVEPEEAAATVGVDPLPLRRDETADRGLDGVPAHRMPAPVDTGDRLPWHDPCRFVDVPVVLRPGEDARGTDQARQILVDGGLNDARSIWLVVDEVHSEGELQRAVGVAIDVRIDREVEIRGQHVARIDERSLRVTRVGAADGVPDVPFRPDPDRPRVEHDVGQIELGQKRNAGRPVAALSPDDKCLVETLPAHQVMRTVDREGPARDWILARGVDVVPELRPRLGRRREDVWVPLVMILGEERAIETIGRHDYIRHRFPDLP